ncbi:MAG: MauE/DoxX family redox-associated membrane protein [Phycisphaerales bacterium]
MGDAADTSRPGRGPGFLTSTFAFIVALAASLVLQFAAVAKVLGPNPKTFLIQPGQYGFTDGVLLDYVVAVSEFVIVLLLMAWHRRRFVWPLVAMMFAVFAGYSLYWTVRGEKCGCFGKLWEPPLGVTLGIDIAMVFLSLMIAGAMRVPKGLIASVLVVCLGMGFGGYVMAEKLAPPKRTQAVGMTGQDRLLASELLKDVKEQPAGGPRWYVFIYDPDCHLCEQMKPMIEMFEQQYAAGDPNMRIRKLSVVEINEKTGIDTFEWNPTPTALLIKDGVVEKVWRGNEVPLPDPEFVMKVVSGAP